MTKWNRDEEPEEDEGSEEDDEGAAKPVAAEGATPTEPTTPTETPDVQLISVKINGKEKDIPLNELVDRYQKGEGSNEKFQEAAMIRKQAQSLLEAMQRDPLAVLRHPALGIPKDKLRKIMEGALYEDITYDQMTPEQKEAVDNKRRLEAMEQEKKIKESQDVEKQNSELEKRYSEQYHKNIVDALEKSNLPKVAYTAKRMAYYMSQVLKDARTRGIKGEIAMPMDKITEIVRKDFEGDLKQMLSALPPDALYTTLGKDILAKIRKEELKKLKTTGKTPTLQGEPQTPRAHRKKKIAMSDWKAKNRAIVQGTE